MQRASFLHDSSGAVLVEAALVMPVLLLLALGVFEYSNMFFKHQAVTAGVRDAARYAARTPRPLGQTCEETLNDVELVSAVKNLAVSGDIFNSTPARVSGWSVDDVSLTATLVENPVDAAGVRVYRGPDPICIVRVSSSYTHARMGLFSGLGFIPATVSISHTERWIGG